MQRCVDSLLPPRALLLTQPPPSDLKYNQLTGSIPSWPSSGELEAMYVCAARKKVLCFMTNTQSLFIFMMRSNLECNQLEGSIPPLGALVNLVSL